MSLQCPSSPVYRTSAQQKLYSKNAAKKIKTSMETIRDELREKCRIRMKESRQMCYGKARNGCDDNTKQLTPLEILQQELNQIDADINIEDEIYKELLEELNQWAVEQFEAENSYLIDIGERNELICPLCQKNTLEIDAATAPWSYKCKCNIRFAYHGDVEQLREALKSKIDQHEENCMAQLIFFVEPLTDAVGNSNNNLLAMCSVCDYFCSLQV